MSARELIEMGETSFSKAPRPGTAFRRPRYRCSPFIAASLLTCLATSLLSCKKQAPSDAQDWSRPVQVGIYPHNLGGIMPHRFAGTLLGLQYQRAASGRCLLMSLETGSSNFWIEVPFTHVPSDYVLAAPTIDHTNRTILFPNGSLENEQLLMKILVTRLSLEGLRDVREIKWTTDKKALLGETPSNVRLNEPGRRRGVSVGRGIMDAPEIYLPFCLDAESISGNTIWRSKFSNGVFHSIDFGKTWKLELISDFDAGAPDMCKTTGYYYCFAMKFPRDGQWFSRKRIDGGTWEASEAVAKTAVNRRGGGPIAEGDTVHLCWLDRRNERHRISIDSPDVGNYEVAYCRWKDSDAGWSKDEILSKGLFYSYDPSMSVEGERLVIAWAGRPGGRLRPGSHHPTDIYYVHSNNAGKTWSAPRRVTSAISVGQSADEPQVVLLQGVIHLFYAQGVENLQLQLSQQSWPIYYQQRPFPN